MNLDDFKIQLNKQLEHNTSFNMPISNITHLHTVKTTSILNKIKKSLVFEIIFGALFALVFILIVFVTKHNSIKIYFTAGAVFVILLCGGLYILLQKTKLANNYGVSIKQNLLQLHHILSTFTKAYFWFTMLIMPVCIAFATFLSYEELHNNSTTNFSLANVFIQSKHLYLIIIAAISFAVFIFFFTKWYLKKLYGNHLAKLQEMINQIDA